MGPKGLARFQGAWKSTKGNTRYIWSLALRAHTGAHGLYLGRKESFQARTLLVEFARTGHVALRPSALTYSGYKRYSM